MRNKVIKVGKLLKCPKCGRRGVWFSLTLNKWVCDYCDFELV